jgi:hypothetical protein
MRELFLPFHRIRPLVFRRGISIEPRVPYAPTGLSRLPLSLFAFISRSPSPPSSLPPSPTQADLDPYGGKEPGSSRGHVGPFFGDKEEAGGVSSRWYSMTEGEPEPARVEGATVRPPGAGAHGGLCGELRRFPREGARDAIEPVHAGASSLLQGGAPSS